ncbi:MAG: trypsin-like peptidase domain-containing protein [Gemmatimonadaceae bacterium]
MRKKTTARKKAPTSTAKSKTRKENVGRSKRDRADDPLFVPHLDSLELRPEGIAARGDEYTAIFETICGLVDDSQPVEQYDGTLGVTAAFVAAHQSAACQVQWNANLASIYTNPGNVSGVRWGSGTMITNDLFLTCGHLFDQTGGGWNRPRQNGTTNIITPQDIATNMHLNFNYQVDPGGTLRAEQSFPITALLEYRLGGLDMAVCRIGGNPGATFGRTAISPTDAAPPDMICVIGHPAGQPKRIEAGPTTSITGNLIHYNDIDTLGGNSGSGILRAADGRLVGIHTNGGCGPSSPAAGSGANFGQRIAAVIAASPILQALPTPKRPAADVPVTLKFRDDIKPRMDVPTTLKFRDDKRKVFDDPIGTLKFRDDVKLSALDKLPGFEGKARGFDNKRGPDDPFRRPPVVRPGEFGRPFILGTPHHSTEWGGEGQQSEMLGQIESALAEMEEAMAAGEAELAQLDAEYRQLLAEYQAAGGDIGGGQ